MTDLFDDPIRVERMARAFEGMARNIERVTTAVVAGGRATDRVIDDAGRKAKDFFDDVSDESDRARRELEDDVTRYEHAWKDAAERIKKHFTTFTIGGGGGPAGALAGLTGPRGVGAVIDQARVSIMRDMPFGGLLGLAVYGRTKDAEYTAAATRIGRTFDKVGSIGKQNIAALTSQVREFAVELGSQGEEISASANALAEYALADEIFGKARIAVDRFGGSILATATAQDQLFKAASGTTGKLIGEAYQATGDEAAGAADSVFRLGFVARTTRSNYEQLASTMLAGVTSLRLQRQSVDDLSASYLRIRQGFAQSQAFRGANMQTVNAAAMQGVGAVSQALTGLPEGLQAVLGGAMSGGKKSGVDAIVAFQEGLAGGQGTGLSDAMKAIRSTILPSLGEGRSEQIFGLQKLMPGLGLRGAQSIVDLNESQLADAFKDPQAKLLDQMKEQSDILKDGFSRQYEEESPFNKTMRGIRDGVAQIGSGLLSLLAVGIMNITTSIRAIGPSVKMAFGQDLDNEDRYLITKSNIAARQTDEALAQMGRGFGDIFGEGKLLAGALMPAVKPTDAEQAVLDRYMKPDEKRIESEARRRVAQELNARDVAERIYTGIEGFQGLSTQDKTAVAKTAIHTAREQLGGGVGVDDPRLYRAIVEGILKQFKFVVDSDPGLEIKLSVQRPSGATAAQSAMGAP